MLLIYVLMSTHGLLMTQEFDPCDGKSSQPTGLDCLTCTGESIEECRQNGLFKSCSPTNSTKHVCHEKRMLTRTGRTVRYEYGCIETSECCGQMWLDHGECMKEGKCGDELYTCHRCLYGCNNDTYRCSARCSDPNWLTFGEKCYYVSSNEPETWNQAQVRCENMNASLVKIDDQAENDFINSNIQGASWIGLSQDDTNTPFITNEFVFPVELEYTNWGVGQPDDIGRGGNQDCVQMLPDGSWNDAKCSELADFACRKDMPFSEVCDIGWTPFNWNCYIVKNDSQSFYEAVWYCLSIGELTIVDEDNSVFLQTLTSNPIWINAVQLDSDPFLWTDGSTPMFINWIPSQPNDGEYIEDCTKISPDDGGMWADDDCLRQLDWVCEKNRSLKKETRKHAGPGQK